MNKLKSRIICVCLLLTLVFSALIIVNEVIVKHKDAGLLVPSKNRDAQI